MVNNFWKQVLSSKDTTSSKRLVTLIISLHFIVASFAILFIAFYVIFYLPKGRVEVELLNMLKQVLEYDFYIILSGLGFITADNLSQMLLEKAKDKNALMSALVNPPVATPPTPPEPPTEFPTEDGPPIEINANNTTDNSQVRPAGEQ